MFWVHGATSNFNLGSLIYSSSYWVSAEKGARTPHGQALISRVHKFSWCRWGTIAKVRKFDLNIIRRLSPDSIILELGSNDLTKLPAQTVGLELETLVRYLHDKLNVKSIAVCQVIRRHSPQCAAYNFKVTKLHLYLKAILETIPYCLYWRPRGFWNSRENIYLPDGVHLNELGKLKLFRSIRGAVIKAVGLMGL